VTLFGDLDGLDSHYPVAHDSPGSRQYGVDSVPRTDGLDDDGQVQRCSPLGVDLAANNNDIGEPHAQDEVHKVLECRLVVSTISLVQIDPQSAELDAGGMDRHYFHTLAPGLLTAPTLRPRHDLAPIPQPTTAILDYRSREAVLDGDLVGRDRHVLRARRPAERVLPRQLAKGNAGSGPRASRQDLLATPGLRLARCTVTTHRRGLQRPLAPDSVRSSRLPPTMSLIRERRPGCQQIGRDSPVSSPDGHVLLGGESATVIEGLMWTEGLGAPGDITLAHPASAVRVPGVRSRPRAPFGRTSRCAARKVGCSPSSRHNR
jgi:hypothetical protein